MFRLANSVELTGLRLFRGAFDMISRDRPAIRVRTADSGARSPPGAASPRFRSVLDLRSGFGRGDVLPGRGSRPGARVEQREEAVSAPVLPVPTERPFDELPVQMLAPEAVQEAEAPTLEVREHAVDPIQDFMRGASPTATAL